MYMERRNLKIAKTILKKKNEMGRLTFPAVQDYPITTIIKTV